MRLRFWGRKRRDPSTTPAPAAESKELDCKFCGPVVADPEQHLTSPEHRLAQARALAPGDSEQEEAADGH